MDEFCIGEGGEQPVNLPSKIVRLFFAGHSGIANNVRGKLLANEGVTVKQSPSRRPFDYLDLPEVRIFSQGIGAKPKPLLRLP